MLLRSTILALCMTIPMMAQTTVIQPSSTPTTQSALSSAITAETRTFALNSGGRLKIKANGAIDIKISAWDKNEVALTPNFTPRGYRGHKGAYGAYPKIKVKSKANSLKLIVKYPEIINERGICQMELQVPEHITCSIKTFNGSITLNGNGINGKIKAKAFNGDLVFNEVNGEVKAKIVNGDITLKNTNGNINARTFNGSISGNSQNVLENLNVRTWNGDIDFNLANPGGAFKAYTGDGNIKIETPWAKDIEIKQTKKVKKRKFSEGGTVIVNGEVVSKPSSVTTRITVTRETAEGNIGSGNARMNFKTRNGSIVIQ